MMQVLKDEFRGLTNNQAYELAFNKRLLRPNLSLPGHFLGNTQRDDFLPHLRSLLKNLPQQAQIFDFGAGAGEIVDLALKHVDNATINIEEPNPLLLAQYIKRVLNSGNLSLGITHNGPLQDYYDTSNVEVARPSVQQDLALAMHMIYHLTSFESEEIDPDADIERAVSTMFSFLKPGGVLFLVFANQLISTTGQASRYYFQRKNDMRTVRNLERICASRDRLLREGSIESHLQAAFTDSLAVVSSTMTDSYIYGESREDIVAMCLTGELGEANDVPFDTEKLDILGDFVDEHETQIGLVEEQREVPQKGMIRANQPQVIVLIQRLSK
ncbi:MAG: class I SAM-dependent methyltransferase [Cyanobacteria bacterium]|nr:class I SAM-dependent methyltransferase [Cyanobacteriota bacterium]